MSRARLGAIVVLAALLTLPASAQPQPRRQPLSPSDVDAIVRLVAAEDQRRLDEAMLAGLSKAPHPEIRRRAVLAGGRIAKPEGRAATTERPVPTEADYRRDVERWVVPDYNGAPRPRAVLTTARGEVEIELSAGDAPLGLEYFAGVVESGEIVGTECGRVVPDPVAQQRAIRNDVTLGGEVSRRGLTRGNLSRASSGLDTGRPGYTLGVTPQPHNEGDFTALGGVVRGMDVVDRLELCDRITAARMVR
jgi:peptidylprolyl isomerase